MASWTEGVRSAQRIIEYVEQCTRENGTYFREVTLYPFRTSGGRSNGVTAWFEHRMGDRRKHICISVYEHWNSDNICLKLSEYVPSNMDEKHDLPTAEFKNTAVQTVVYAIQNFLYQYFDLSYPKEWYVPALGFQGITTASDEMIDAADDAMMPAVMDWCEVEGLDE